MYDIKKIINASQGYPTSFLDTGEIIKGSVSESLKKKIPTLVQGGFAPVFSEIKQKVFYVDVFETAVEDFKYPPRDTCIILFDNIGIESSEYSLKLHSICMALVNKNIKVYLSTFLTLQKFNSIYRFKLLEDNLIITKITERYGSIGGEDEF